MIVFNENSCIKCGACEGVCPTAAIEVGDHIVYCDTCNEEPKCAEVCPNGALQVDEIAIDEEGNTQVRLIFNKTKCDECGDCVDACPTKTLKLDAEDSQLLKGFCVMCQKCVDICPVDVIGVPGVKEPASRVIEPEGPVYIDDCKGCGVCVAECPVDAITLSAYGEPIEVDEEKCIQCGVCSQSCPWNAIFIAENANPAKRTKNMKSFTLDAESCIGCNSCVDICPGSFITPKSDLTVDLPEACAACGLCVNVCPVDAIDLDVEYGASKFSASEGICWDEEKCLFDGGCALKCPTEAIKVVTKRGMEVPSRQKDMGEQSFTMCVRCGACANVCPNDALILDYVDKEIDGEVVSRDRIIFNPSKCDECGECIDACPYDMLHKAYKVNLPIAGFCTLCEQCIAKCTPEALFLK